MQKDSRSKSPDLIFLDWRHFKVNIYTIFMFCNECILYPTYHFGVTKPYQEFPTKGCSTLVNLLCTLDQVPVTS